MVIAHTCLYVSSNCTCAYCSLQSLLCFRRDKSRGYVWNGARGAGRATATAAEDALCDRDRLQLWSSILVLSAALLDNEQVLVALPSLGSRSWMLILLYSTCCRRWTGRSTFSCTTL